MEHPSVSFAGCGFIGVYQIGVIAALREYAPHLLEGDILGSSSGAMLGVALVAGISTEDIARTTLRIANKVSEKILGPITPSFDLNTVFREVYEEMLPEDIAKKASSRLHISMTKIPEFSNSMINFFTTKDDVIEALLCSSFIPMAFGWIPPRFRGNACIDGFYSNNQPILNTETITVTVFAGDSSICPNDGDEGAKLINLHFPQGPDSNINVSWNNSIRMGNTVVPPPTKTMLKICTQGYSDAVRYLSEKGHLNIFESSPHTLPEEVLNVFEEEIAREGENERNLSFYIFKLPVAMWQTAFSM